MRMQYRDNAPNESVIYRGEIYLVDLTGYIGSEQNGVRPAVILQNDSGNEHSPTTIIAPLTSRSKKMSATHVSLAPTDADVVKESTVLLEQIRVVDRSRIRRRLGAITNPQKIDDINTKIMVSLGIAEVLCTV